MNYFDYNTAAKRYAKGRPYFHPLVIGKIAEFTRIPRFKKALDVCCGTGQSTQALLAIADQVMGVDRSLEMLNLAPRNPAIIYRCSPAEELRLPDSTFDLLTVALGFHWLNRARFLPEARRVLQDGAWMVIYQNYFCGTMRGNPGYEAWNKGKYLTRYPTPPRNWAPFTKADVRSFGFEFVATENYANEVNFSVEQLACYLTTQSNMIAALESGRESEPEALRWLEQELTPYFSHETETFPFGGSIWYLQKQ